MLSDVFSVSLNGIKRLDNYQSIFSFSGFCPNSTFVNLQQHFHPELLNDMGLVKYSCSYGDFRRDKLLTLTLTLGDTNLFIYIVSSALLLVVIILR